MLMHEKTCVIPIIKLEILATGAAVGVGSLTVNEYENKWLILSFIVTCNLLSLTVYYSKMF